MRCYNNKNRRRPTSTNLCCLVQPSFYTIWIISLLSLLLVPPFVDGYASWLRCYVELDESEVVMHQYIIPADETTDVSIEIQECGTSDNDQWISSEYTPSTTTTLNTPFNIKVRLQFPYHLLRQDVQYVIEIVTEEDDDEQEGEGEEDNNKAVVAEFIDRGVMCEGQRAFSRSSDHVVLKIYDISQPIELVAGYAPGMEAVRLTPKFTITTNISSSEGSAPTEGQEGSDSTSEEKEL